MIADCAGRIGGRWEWMKKRMYVMQRDCEVAAKSQNLGSAAAVREWAAVTGSSSGVWPLFLPWCANESAVSRCSEAASDWALTASGEF